jgi:hypothetical protein
MIASDNGKNKFGLPENAIIPGIKDRMSKGKTKYEIFPTIRCSLYLRFLIKKG